MVRGDGAPRHGSRRGSRRWSAALRFEVLSCNLHGFWTRIPRRFRARAIGSARGYGIIPAVEVRGFVNPHTDRYGRHPDRYRFTYLDDFSGADVPR